MLHAFRTNSISVCHIWETINGDFAGHDPVCSPERRAVREQFVGGSREGLSAGVGVLDYGGDGGNGHIHVLAGGWLSFCNHEFGSHLEGAALYVRNI